MKYKNVATAIAGKNFNESIQWVLTNLKDAERDGMGDKNIARFRVNEAEYSHVMFYNHGGLATDPSFCFN